MPTEIAVLQLTARVDTKAAERGLSDLERKAQRTTEGINRSIGSLGSGSDALLGGLGGALKLLPGITDLGSAISKVAGMVAGALKPGFDYQRMLEENMISFVRLTGSADAAREHIKQLETLRFDGIGLEEALQGSKRLQAMGYAAKDIVPIMRTVGDAARGMGADVSAVTRALTQMSAKGKVSAEEVTQQLAEQGIPAWKYLADSIAQVDKNFARLTSDQRIAKVQKLAELGKISGKGGAKAILMGMEKDFGGTGRSYAEGTASGLEARLGEDTRKLLGSTAGPALEEYRKALRLGIMGVNSEAALGAAESAAKIQTTLFGAFHDAVGGLESVMPAAHAAGAKLGTSAEKGLRDSLDMHSPSKVMFALGYDAGMSFNDGLDASIQDGKKRFDPTRYAGVISGSQDPANDGRRGKKSRRTTNPAGGSASPSTIEALRRSIIGQESEGKFDIVNPHSGALGLGQVMPFNVASWTKEALGPVLSPNEFLKNKEAQLKVINYKLNEYLQKELQRTGGDLETAVRRVASTWYSGDANLFNSTKRQVTKGHEYPSIDSYTKGILRRFQAEQGVGGNRGIATNSTGAATSGGMRYDEFDAETGKQIHKVPVTHMPYADFNAQQAAKNADAKARYDAALANYGKDTDPFAAPPYRPVVPTFGQGASIAEQVAAERTGSGLEDTWKDLKLIEAPVLEINTLIPQLTKGTIDWGKTITETGQQASTSLSQVAVTYEELFGKQRTLKDELMDLQENLPSLHKELTDIVIGLPEGLGGIFGGAVMNWDGTFRGFLVGLEQGVASTLQNISAQLIQSQATKIFTFLLQSVIGAGGGAVGGGLGMSGTSGGAPASNAADLAKWAFGGNHAEGGLLRGPGDGRSDSILLWGSHGEYVSDAATVAYYGPNYFSRLKRREMPRMAAGGVLMNTGGRYVANQYSNSSKQIVQMPTIHNHFEANRETGAFSKQSAEQAARRAADNLNSAVRRS